MADTPPTKRAAIATIKFAVRAVTRLATAKPRMAPSRSGRLRQLEPHSKQRCPGQTGTCCDIVSYGFPRTHQRGGSSRLSREASMTSKTRFSQNRTLLRARRRMGLREIRCRDHVERACGAAWVPSLLSTQNKPEGYMCVSCAWAKPAKTHPLEFCENGAKGHGLGGHLATRRPGILR
jgi:hypothetical protein